MKKCWTDSDAHMYILSNKCNTNKKASELLYSGISDNYLSNRGPYDFPY